MVTWTLGEASLRYYLSTGSFQVLPSDGYDWFVGEVDFVSDGPAPPLAARRSLPGFRQIAYERVGRLYIRSYEPPARTWPPCSCAESATPSSTSAATACLLDGIGPGCTASLGLS